MRILFADYIIRWLIAATDAHTAELVQIPVKLQDHTGFDRNVLVALMDGSQYITISGDFFLTAVAWSGLVFDDFFQTLIGGIDALNSVGALRTLNPGDLN